MNTQFLFYFKIDLSAIFLIIANKVSKSQAILRREEKMEASDEFLERIHRVIFGSSISDSEKINVIKRIFREREKKESNDDR